MATKTHLDRVQELGHELFQSMQQAKTSVFAKAFWQDQLMDWSMRDEAFKVEMFRFVDVFPVLENGEQVARHLKEYFCRPGQNFPKALQWGLAAVSPKSRIAKMAAGRIEKQIKGMALRFIAGQDANDALPTLRKMRQQGLSFTVDLLGEACVSEAEADVYRDRYLALIDTLSKETGAWQTSSQVDGARFPRVNVSVKLSALYSQLDVLDVNGALTKTKARLRPIFRLAAERGVFINLDLESYAYKDLTFTIFKSLLEEPEFATLPMAGCVVQGYLRDSAADLQSLIKWAKKRRRRIAIRLVKGAYWDYEVVRAQQHGWEIPVFTDKRETDANYEALTELLMASTKYVTPAIASHNVRSIAFALAQAERRKLSRDDFEFQMLYGMADPLKEALINKGFRVRDYVPVGELVPGMAYLVRRLLENTSNESWLRKGMVEQQDLGVLLGDPMKGPASPSVLVDVTRDMPQAGGLVPFTNLAGADFVRADHRMAMQNALAEVRKKQLGRHHPLVINGRNVDVSRKLKRFNPANTQELIGTVASAGVKDAERAIQAARAAFPAWRDTDPATRAKLLLDVAEAMRQRRWQLSALIVLEVGKSWREADADVCEAVDFLEFYARDMLRLATPRRLGHYPGELNHYFYQARGVCGVIAPWNFPLAILTGMTAAALVCGNTVVMKPAEQSSIIAAHLMTLFSKAGVPAGVLNFLPGPGEEVGAHLAAHPEVPLIAFTGSMDVGLHIYRQVGETLPGQPSLRRFIGELGGKNAIIVDDDADLDEAVLGVIQSAFNYQGQKCSACSRAIVLDTHYDTFLHRLAEATRSLTIGPPEEPRHKLGPVIDEDAQQKIQGYIELGKREGRLLVQTETPAGGSFVPATVIADVAPDSRLAQEEIFGPVLAVMRASSFEEALEMANATPYALTGGVYSRSPNHIARAREAYRVGNLYINRTCTGALVWRQPFGGFQRSGVGSKAGGPDYLLQFMEPRVVSENTMRRGFAPMDDDAEQH